MTDVEALDELMQEWRSSRRGQSLRSYAREVAGDAGLWRGVTWERLYGRMLRYDFMAGQARRRARTRYPEEPSWTW